MIFKQVLFNDFHSMLLSSLAFFRKTKKILNQQFFLVNQINFWQDFLVELAVQIPEKNCQKFFEKHNLKICRNFLKTENLASFLENFLYFSVYVIKPKCTTLFSMALVDSSLLVWVNHLKHGIVWDYHIAVIFFRDKLIG